MISSKEKILNSSIRFIERILTGTTTPGQSESGDNGNKHCAELQDWSLIIKCSFLSYPGHLLGVGEFTSLRRCSRCILQSSSSELKERWVNWMLSKYYWPSFSSWRHMLYDIKNIKKNALIESVLKEFVVFFIFFF